MEEWMHFEVDFSQCKNWRDLHLEVKQKLDFPDHYGENLDALWDCVARDMYTPAYITIRGISKLPKNLIPRVEDMLVVFRRAETMYGKIRVCVEE